MCIRTECYISTKTQVKFKNIGKFIFTDCDCMYVPLSPMPMSILGRVGFLMVSGINNTASKAHSHFFAMAKFIKATLLPGIPAFELKISLLWFSIQFLIHRLI